MAEFITEPLGERRNRISTSSEDSSSSRDNKKSRNSISTDAEIAEEDTILTALDMTANMAKKLEEILERLKKLDVIESSVKSIETKLNCLEERTAVLENFRQTAEKDINDLKENGDFTSSQLSSLCTAAPSLKKIDFFEARGGCTQANSYLKFRLSLKITKLQSLI